MLSQAMDAFLLQQVKHVENTKAQYTDKGEVKNYFRASELGSGDRKLFYSFFSHQLKKLPKTVKNLRQLVNGDKVHEKYQQAWEDMGALISMEERLSSRDNEDLKDFDWEWAGHYDGLLDLNILRGYALGKIKAESIPMITPEGVSSFQLDPEVDEDFAEEIGIFKPNYNPPKLVADIKTMNPWGFKKVVKGDLSSIKGYLDQISFYMFMLDSPYGAIYIENKEDNATCEVQVVWEDFKGGSYDFRNDLHGEIQKGVVRTTITTLRMEQVIDRLDYLWDVVERARDAVDAGLPDIAGAIVPARCSEDPQRFPCSWGHQKGEPTYCEFYQHCWNGITEGQSVFSEEVPADAIWEFETEEDKILRIDNRKVPKTVKTQEDFITWVTEQGIEDFSPYEVVEEVISLEEIASATEGDELFDAQGNLIMHFEKPTEVQEYTTEDGSKAVKCPKCNNETRYKRLAKSGSKKCMVCSKELLVVRS